MDWMQERGENTSERKLREYRRSIDADKRLYFHDIVGSIAFADMLASKGVLTHDEADEIAEGLIAINNDMDSGKLQADPSADNVDAFLEKELTERIGDAGHRLFAERSRQEQASLNLKLYLRDETDGVKELLVELITAVTAQAEKCKAFRAQGDSFALSHRLLAYAFMLKRDYERLGDASKRMNYSPIGPGKSINCDMVAASLGFDGIMMNSLDAASDRDYCVEICSALATVMTHLSRFSGEILGWVRSGWLELGREYIDAAALCCGKASRVCGDAAVLMTLAGNCTSENGVELQEAQAPMFDALDTVKLSLELYAPLVRSAAAQEEQLSSPENADTGWVNRELEYVQGWLTGIRASMAQRQRDMAQQMME